MKSRILLVAILIFCMSYLGSAIEDDYMNQTPSEAAANMTRSLNGMRMIGPEISSANVQIKPNVCMFEITAKRPVAVSWVVAPLYASYLKSHPDYIGNLVVNVYALDKTLLMTTTAQNGDARSNYEGVSYLMDKNADYLQYPAKRTDGLETPSGIGY